MTPASLDPFSYLLTSLVWKAGIRRTSIRAYVVAKKAAIIFKTSVSLLEVSSNPGVSMRITFLPSRVNSSASWTSAVHDSKLIPTRRFERLARLINWRDPSESPVIITDITCAYRCFPTPSCAHNTAAAVRMAFQQVSGLSYTYAIVIGGSGFGRRLLALALLNGGGGLWGRLATAS